MPLSRLEARFWDWKASSGFINSRTCNAEILAYPIQSNKKESHWTTIVSLGFLVSTAVRMETVLSRDLSCAIGIIGRAL